MALTKETEKVLGEMRRKIKDESDSFLEALKRIAKGDKDELTAMEVLVFDNKVRAENGMAQLKQYPIICDEYSPSMQKGTYKKLIKVIIKREKNKLPIPQAIYEECEGVETAFTKDEIEEEVDEMVKELYPDGIKAQDEKAKRSMIRESIIKKHERELAGVTKEEPKEEPKKPGRPKGQ